MNDLWLLIAAGLLILLAFHIAVSHIHEAISLEDLDPQDWRIVLDAEVVQ